MSKENIKNILLTIKIKTENYFLSLSVPFAYENIVYETYVPPLVAISASNPLAQWLSKYGLRPKDE